MKRIRGKKLTYLMAPFLLLAGACSQEDMTGGGGLGNPDNDGLTEVTLDVSLPTAGVNSRADGDVPHISSASKVDMLIYAVYDVTNGYDNLEPVNFYQVNFDDPTKAGKGQNFDDINNKPTKIPAGQTYVGFGAKSKHSIVFKINPDKKYRVVFWAQDSRCDAYNTEDLQKILVSYDGAKNNDESRDAFTAVSPEYTGNIRVKQEVVLRRAVAQINIGTSGADYANLIYDPTMLPQNVTINESTITVTGVADQFNALTGEARASKKDIVAKFDWAPLPAWTFLDEAKIPSFTSYNASVWEDNHDENPFVQLQGELAIKEEFLHIDFKDLLAQGRGGYLIEYPTINADGLYVTDAFKYLSMCYVLVEGKVNEETLNPNSSNVTVNYDLRQNKKDEIVRLTERELLNVPVQGNFRTNILGGLFAGRENEPDPTSIFNFYQLPMIINEIFDNHENERYHSAILKVKRDIPYNDGLQVKTVFPEEVFSTVDDKGDEVLEFTRTIFFTKESVAIEFKFDKTFTFYLETSVDGEYYEVDEDHEKVEGYTVVKLTLKEDATAGTFKVRIGK